MYICEKGHLLEHEVKECPHCQCLVEEAAECEKCLMWTWKDELDHGCCPDCQDILVDKVIRTIKSEFSPKERHLFREWVTEEAFERLWEDD